MQYKQITSLVLATVTCLISAVHLDQNDFEILQHQTGAVQEFFGQKIWK